MERVSIYASSTGFTSRLWPLVATLALTMGAAELRGLTLKPDHESYLQQPQGLSLEQLQQRALQEGEAGKTDEAIQDYQKALQLEPSWKEGQWNLGSLEYSAGRFDDARATFTEVVQFAPNLGTAWALLGLSEYEVKSYADALVHLQKAQSLEVKDDAEIARVSAYHLALLQIRSAEFEQAHSLLIVTFGSAPMTSQVKTALGLAGLRIPLLPEEIDPTHDALILAVGGAISSGPDGLAEFAKLINTHGDIPYLHYAYALDLAQAGHSNEAIAHFQEETRVSPQSPLPWIELSRLEASTPDKALLSANKAVAIAPGSRETHEALANADKAAGQASQATAEMESAHALSPWLVKEARITERFAGIRNGDGNAAQTSLPQALQEYSAGQYSKASAGLKGWLKVHPEDGTALAMLGLCEFELQDFDNARIHLDRGAQLGLNGSPDSIKTAKYTFGILLIHAGDFDRATEVLVSANTAGSDDSKLKYALGLALLRKPIFPQESETDARLISAAGEISVLLQQSRYDEAFPRFQQLLTEYPTTPFLHYAYGTALLALSEFDEATAQMNAEIILSSGSELPLLRLASIALRQHRSGDAIAWAQRALSLAQNSVEGHYLLGRACLEKGDNITAVQQLEIASKLSPGSPEIHFNLAKAYDRARIPVKAEQERAIFARLNATSESQRSHQGTQTYTGPRDTGVITHSTPNESPSSSPRVP